MLTAPAPLSAEGLVKRFGQGPGSVTALAGIDFELRHGEFVAVMGASGSGKSTLLHLMAGLTSPSEGRVVVEGRDLTGLSDYRLTLFRRDRIGLVFQSFNLIPTLTAEENVLLPLRAAGLTRAGRAHAEGLLDQLGLAGRRHHRPDALSGGEQQRVAIARALVADPAIVLADEPTGNLDSASSRSICETLRTLNETQSKAIVVVTHDPSVATWADRVVVLKDGSVCADFAAANFETPEQLASHYHKLTSGETQRSRHART